MEVRVWIVGWELRAIDVLVLVYLNRAVYLLSGDDIDRPLW